MARQLRIAFIVNEFPCISETFILNQITGLLALGHDVRIFAYRASQSPKQHAAIAKWELLKRTKYFASIPEGRVARLIKFLTVVARQILRRPSWILRCLSFKALGFYESLNRLFLLESLMDKPFDVIHCQFGILGKSWVYLKDMMKVTLVTSFRGYDLEKYVRANHPNVYSELFERGDMFLPVCDYFAKKLRDLGCPPEKIRVHYSGVDTAQFAFYPRQIDGKEIRIFSVARLVEKKGLEYSIRAAAKLVPRYPAIKYTIAGDGPLRSRLEALIRELGMENHIHLTGPLLSDEVKELMNQANIFILASVTAQDGDQEGIPLSLREAMAVGLPVISTRHSGIPELIEDGKTGCLVPEKDIDGLVRACEYLISNPPKYAEMGRAARKFVEENLGIAKLNHRLEELYLSSLCDFAGERK